jgi:thiamine-monophosphate kinase
MNEFELIARLTRNLPSHPSVIAGPGDDCAVLDLGLPGRYLLFKTDAVVEGVHFLPETPAEKAGHKALARCLSDIAAMAGTPHSAVITLAAPAGYATARLEGFYAGLSETARRYEVAIVGGETTTNPERFLVSVAMVGTAPRDRWVSRTGAKPGDALFVTGELGGSILGKHLDFAPRLAEAQWLAEHFPLHAMIDLSDGLAGDLRHLMQAAGVGAELLARAIPISRAARLLAREPADAHPDRPAKRSPLQAALADGEDFELLFSLPAAEAVRLSDAWRSRFPKERLSCIGRITPEPGLRLRDHRGAVTLEAHGYTHFGDAGTDAGPG